MCKLWKKNNFTLIFCSLLLAALATGLARYHYLAELSTHLTLQFLMASIVLLIAFIFLPAKKWKIAVAGCLVLYFSAPLVSLMLPRPLNKADIYEDISVMQFNINYANKNADKFAGWINNYATIDGRLEQLAADKQPDIIVLQEVSLDVAAKLGDLYKTYPYHFVKAKDGFSGMAIFSKLPIKEKHRRYFPDSDNQYSEVSFTTFKEEINFTLTEMHAIPPMGARREMERNEELEYIGHVLNDQLTRHRILVGDFNITPYSPYFRDLEKKTQLTSALQGNSLVGSWPSFYPGIFRIPIDHLLTSDNIEVMSREVQKDMDSDHLPVLTKLRLYKTR